MRLFGWKIALLTVVLFHLGWGSFFPSSSGIWTSIAISFKIIIPRKSLLLYWNVITFSNTCLIQWFHASEFWFQECHWSDQVVSILVCHNPRLHIIVPNQYGFWRWALDISLIFQLLIFIEREKYKRRERGGGRRPGLGQAYHCGHRHYRQPQSTDYNIVTPGRGREPFIN